MAANTSPIFPAVVRNVGLSVVPNGAITARTAIAGVTGLGLLFTAGANGSRIDQCTLQATGTTLAGLLDFWVYDGTTSRMLSETLVAVVAASTTVAGWTTVVTFTNLVIPSGYGLYISSQVGSQLVGAITTGGDY
jgi:uncharacterized membrane protein